MELGRRLRQARRARGLSLEQLSARTGLSLRFLSELERGKAGHRRAGSCGWPKRSAWS
ncbi:MAG: helix-turn-helix domain-containing protein [Myxococcales bacterium]|nr:helix-turn-helix domain-containing protein [Myxococcales bacterium]